MPPSDLSQRCPGCLQDKGAAVVCPRCGYDEKQNPIPSRPADPHPAA
jgi:hypothetical protein